MKLNELRKEFIKEMSYIPAFINNTTKDDKELWDYLCLINDILISIISDQELSIRYINRKVSDMDILLKNLHFFEKSEDAVTYIGLVISYMVDRSIEEECYEVTANIKKFNDKLYKLIIKDDLIS